MNMLNKSAALSLLVISSLNAADSVSTIFSEGKTSGNIRAYHMIEDNGGDLQDYRGTTLGAKLKYETSPIYNLKAGIAFYTTKFLNTNVSSTNVEPTAGNKGSRYVAGLVDAADHDNHNISGVGELYLKYNVSKTSVTAGRMKLKTPFINPEDGRMIPTLEQGLWVKSADVDGFVFQGGFINGFWNRSTEEWKSAENSLGYGYAQGKAPIANTNGDYSGNTQTDGVYVLSAIYNATPGIKLAVWDYYIDNILNTFYAQGDYVVKMDKLKFLAAFQYVGQQEVGDGGNDADNVANPTLAQQAQSFMLKDEKSNTYGVKAGAGYDDTFLTFAYTATTDEGRFLFPREWGKEPIFTFQKRERTDGSGDSQAWLITLDQNFKGLGLNGLTATLGYGEYTKPDAKNFVLNKYGIPSYTQTNLDIFYKFDGELKGLKLEYLIASKTATGETYETPTNTNFVFRKNDIVVHNFIMNYTF
jgi:hypothetical protein